MEEVREFKHGCKYCSKSFPCGRSLGGHMRSHLINNSTEAEEKLSRSKLPSLNNGGLSKASKPETSFEAAPPPGYGLRENPKKTWRISDSSDETSCLCKECGKAFQSWKALFGHMKCHSEKERGCSINNNFSQEEQDSWSSDQEKELVFDSNSDNETTTASRKRRSQRTRYLGTAANSSSFSNLANGSSSVSEIEQEQEEVAMCLMMLSRDVTNWVASKSAAESSDNFSEFSKSKKLNPKTPDNFKLDGKKPENSVPGVSKLWSKIDRAEVSIGGFLKKDKILDSKAKLAQESDFGELSSKKYNPSKRKLQFDPELRLKSATKDVAEPEISKISHKRSKFECTTCNKIFHSYQALGGHRASHKKTKGCFASTAESSENSIETEIRPPVPTPETKPIKLYKKENLFDHINFGDDHDDEKAKRVLEAKIKIVSKKTKGHECPICFKIFSSGQALGGHKRSHLINTSEARTNPAAIVIEKPISEIRDFLDLNLPAPTEEEEEEEEESSNGHEHVASIKPWWVERNEALVGLISN